MELGARNDLPCLLKVLTTSKVVEDRVKVLDELATPSSFTSSSDQLGIVTALTTCWEEDSGSIVRNCKWRTSLCRVANSRLSLSERELQTFTLYVQLATKASEWCSKCLTKQAVPESKSKGVRQDVLPKLLSETSSLSMATFIAAMECSFWLDKQFITSVALLISETFTWVKVLCFSSKARTESQGAEMYKVGSEVLGSALRLISKVGYKITTTTTGFSTSTTDVSAEGLKMVRSALEGLEELGTLAARVEWGKLYGTGGKNITMLNLAWKSCMTMVTQTEGGRTIIASAAEIETLISLLISHATYSLKLAAEVWLSAPSLAGAISSRPKDSEFRKHCILVKFFLGVATKVCAVYPKEASVLRKSIVDCVLKVITLLLLNSGEKSLPKQAVELLSETAAPPAFGLVPSLLSAPDDRISLKIQFLQYIGLEYEPSLSVENLGLGGKETEEDISLPLWDEITNDKFLPSRVVLFLHLVQSSQGFGPKVFLELLRMLDWMFNSLAQEEVYFAFLQNRIFPSNSSSAIMKPKGQLMYVWALRALETFCCVASASPEAWIVVQEYLFKYALQPCILGCELIKHLWCFIAQHSEAVLIQSHISLLVSLLRSATMAEDQRQQATKRLAQLVCALVQAVPKAGASHLYSLVFREDPFATLSNARTVSALLQEGFSFGLLQDTARKSSTINFLKQCLAASKQVNANKEGLEGTSQEAIQCILYLLRESTMNKLIDSKQMVEIRRMTLDAVTKESNGSQHPSVSITEPILQISSLFLKQKVHPKTLQSLLEKIQELVKSMPPNFPSGMKPAFAEFLSSLSDVEFKEEESDPSMQALWYLYHKVLCEPHWALVHAGLVSFGHFAEHTPCNELWRFVPSDPGLASDVSGSSETGADMFMNTLKSYLEKDTPCSSLTVTDDEIDLLHQEAKRQRTSYFQVLQQKGQDLFEEKTTVVDCDSMDVDTPVTASPIPNEVKTAILMLQEGYSILSNIPPNWLGKSVSKLKDWQLIVSQLADVNKKLSSL